MNHLLTQAERIMVIMAHPDDAEIQCGGSVARFVRAGKKVVYVLCTSGNRGTADRRVSAEQLAARRESEQRAAAAVLGVQDVIFLRHNDGDLAYERETLRREVVACLRQHRPDVVFTHDAFAGIARREICYLHPDHRAVGEVVLESAFFCAPGPLFYPEQIAKGLTPHKVSAVCLAMSDCPDAFVDIAETFETKVAAIAQHASQWGQHSDLAGFFRQIAEELGQAGGVPLAEAFKQLQA